MISLGLVYLFTETMLLLVHMIMTVLLEIIKERCIFTKEIVTGNGN